MPQKGKAIALKSHDNPLSTACPISTGLLRERIVLHFVQLLGKKDPVVGIFRETFWISRGMGCQVFEGRILHGAQTGAKRKQGLCVTKAGARGRLEPQRR